LYLIISYALSFLPILLPWSWDTAFLFALFLFEGFLIRKYNILEKITTNHIILLIIIYAIFRYYTWSVNLSIRYYGRSLFLLFPGASVGSVILITLAKKVEGKNISHIFSKIGRNSLSIFCIHWPFITISERLLYYINLPKDTIIYDVIHLTTILLITYPIALIIERFLIKPIYRINPFKSS
jgi:peptidoglycan/LPS O-acetylase OafA/YrhL